MGKEAIDYWEGSKKGERLGKDLTGYARVMFPEEADYMLETGKALSDEWFEVWDGLLPPQVYSMIAAKEGKLGKYERVLFIDRKTTEKVGITLRQKHPNYDRQFPAIFLNRVRDTGVLPSEVVDLSRLVNDRIQNLPSDNSNTATGWWTYAEIALQPIPKQQEIN